MYSKSLNMSDVTKSLDLLNGQFRLETQCSYCNTTMTVNDETITCNNCNATYSVTVTPRTDASNTTAIQEYTNDYTKYT